MSLASAMVFPDSISYGMMEVQGYWQIEWRSLRFEFHSLALSCTLIFACPCIFRKTDGKARARTVDNQKDRCSSVVCGKSRSVLLQVAQLCGKQIGDTYGGFVGAL